MLKNLLKQIQGFTLIELLVVIAIIAILAATISVNYSSAQKTTRDSKRQIDMDNTAAALTLYYSEKKEYPNVSSWDQLATELRNGGYMTTVPVDPKNNEAYKYNYYSNADGSMFAVYSRFENEHNLTLMNVTTLPPWDANNISLGNGIFKVGDSYYYRSVGK